MQYVGEKRVEQLTLHVYYGGEDVKSTLYEDSGDGYDYEKGIYNIKSFTTKTTPSYFEMSLLKKGHFEPDYTTYRIVLHGLPFKPSGVYLNEKEVKHEMYYYEKEALVIIADRSTFFKLRVEQ
jgi:alpha-glucosidase